MLLAESSVSAPGWFVAVFFAGMFLSACGLCALQSLLGGWYRLARAFPRLRPAEEMLFQSEMSIGTGLLPLHYWGLWVRVGPDGLELSVFPAFRILHPPMTIPWGAIECTREVFLSTECTAVHISNPRNRLIFTGSQGDYIHDYWAGRVDLSEVRQPSCEPVGRPMEAVAPAR